MQMHLTSIDHAKGMAKTLRDHLSEIGKAVKLSKAQEAVASMLGHASWHALSASVGASLPSLMEHDIDEAERAARAARFRIRLAASLNLSQADAALCVDRLRPLAMVRGPADAVDWRRRYLAFRLNNPLAGWPRNADLQDALGEILGSGHGRGILSAQRDAVLPDGSSCSVLSGHGDQVEAIAIGHVSRLVPVFAMFVRRGKVIASARGFIVSPREGVTYADMVESMRGVDQGAAPPDVYDACLALARDERLLRHMPRLEAFRTTLVITHWARHIRLAPAFAGMEMARALMRCACALDHPARPAEVAINSGPAQYYATDGSGWHEPGYGDANQAMFLHAFWSDTDLDLNSGMPEDIKRMYTFDMNRKPALA